MEKRLCYFRESFSPGEAGKLDPRTLERPNRRAELRKLDADIIKQRKIDVIRNGLNPHNPDLAIEDNYGEALPNRLREISKQYAPALRGDDGIEKRLMQDLRLTGPARDEIRKMIDAIARPLPAQAARGRVDHRYVRMIQGDGKDKEDWYGINFAQVDTDRKLLNDLRIINGKTGAPNAQLDADIGVLEHVLGEFAKQDNQINLHNIRTAPEAMDATFKEMGRMSIVMIAGAMTLLTGFIGVINFKNKGITAMSSALLYGIVTLAAAKPDLIKRMIGPEHEAYVEDLKTAMNGKGLENASIEYRVMGPAWKTFVSKLMNNDTTTADFLAEARTFGEYPGRDTLAIDRYVNSMMPDTGTARADLKAMILAGNFEPFVNRLTSVSDNDAKATVLDLVSKGSLQYGRVARADAKHAEEELIKVEKSLPPQTPAG